ncbi:MAG TPA: winged helix-turn-helix domain-containing protein [Bryocella sp.]|nr:winged helix-turn-helix domain-containing protein [Bryocella sp.]
MGQESTYRFGMFELDPIARQLRKNGVRLKLYGQSFQILLMLLGRPGEVVSREELRKGIWPEGTFVDFEHGLNAAIKNLRRTLSDSAEKPLFVETIPRVGYRFCGRVDQVPSAKQAVPETSDARLAAPPEREEVEAAEASLPPLSISRRPFWSRWQASALVLLVVIGAIASVVYWRWLRPHALSEAQSGRVMVAVLPFQNLTGDAAQDYFSDGFSEDLIAQLGPRDPEHLEVVARTSTMAYKNEPAALSEIGRELGVQYAIEGAVQRDGDNLRISTQLIRVKDQTCLWSRQYNRKLDDPLAVEDEIAREIVDEIELTFGSRTPARSVVAKSPESYETYDLYLRGRYFWNKRTAEGFHRAVDYFQQAIAKDPRDARAYAGLADTYAMMSSWDLVSPNEFMPKARAAALKALQLDDALPEAHASLALIVENYDWDWKTAEREYRRAIELNPGYASAHQWYAECLTWEGRFDEAARESERARQLDPLSLIIAADRGAMLYYSRKYKQSIDQFHSVLEMDPHFPRTVFVVYPYIQSRMYAPAFARVKELRAGFGDADWLLSMQAYVEANAGRREEARLALENLQQLSRRHQVDPQLFFWPYIALGDKEKALDSLEQALSQHSNIITSLKVEPAFDPLRGDPRFQSLMRRAGLAN